MRENEISASAVHATEISVINHVENLLLIFAYIRLAIVVPRHVVTDMNPAYETGTPRSENIIGQAAPSIESGKPNEMKARYITISKRSENIAGV